MIDSMERIKTTKNFIDSMFKYCLNYADNYGDIEVMDILVNDFGITQEDFIMCGYGDFVKEYFQ